MRCISVITQDSFLFIVGTGAIYRKSVNAPGWEPACLMGGFHKIRSTGNALFCYNSGSLFRSLNNGDTWENIDMGYEYATIECVDSAIVTLTDFGLYRSLDNGVTWTEIHPEPLSSGISWIFAQDSILFCYLEDIDLLFLSLNYGDSWITYPLTGLNGNKDQPHFYNNDLWMSSANEFYIFNELINEWILQQDTLPVSIWYSYLIDDGETLYCCTNNGFFRYNVGSSSWEDESQGLEDLYCWDACCDDNVILLATRSGLFSKYENEPWIPLYNDLFGLEVNQLLMEGDGYYATANDSIYYSDDVEIGFETWETQGFYPAHKLISHPSGWCEGSDSGFLISLDTGHIWTGFDNGLEDIEIYDIARTNVYYYAMAGVGLFRSHTYFNNWERVPDEIGNMHLSDIDVLYNVLFAVGNGLLYRSTDFGTSFEAVPEAGNGNYLYTKNNKMFFYNNTEIKYSTDLGGTWQSWLTGITNADIINCMDISDSEDATVVGGFVGPWNPVPFLKIFSPENPEGKDISDNLNFYWSSVYVVKIKDGRIFACPSSGGLWYRDDLMVGVKEDDAPKPGTSSLSIYPNPASETIQICLQNPLTNAEYQVLDFSGRMMMKGLINNESSGFSLNLTSLPDGMYFIIILYDDGTAATGKFLKIE